LTVAVAVVDEDMDGGALRSGGDEGDVDIRRNCGDGLAVLGHMSDWHDAPAGTAVEFMQYA